MINLRCSGLNRVAACPASAVPPEVRIETTSEAASMGSAVHEYLAESIRGSSDPYIPAIAAKHGITDIDDLATNCRVALSLWRKVAPHFPDPVTEHTFEPILWSDEDDLHQTKDIVRLTGTADVLSISEDGKTINLLDFKSGWNDGDHDQQLRGYAWLALNEDLGAERVKAVVLRTRLGVIDVEEWTREELATWADSLFRRVVSQRDIYRPSVEACGYCPRAHECPARQQMLQNAVFALALPESRERSEIASVAECAPDQLAGILADAKMVANFADEVAKIVKAEVIARGGSIPLPDGRELIVKDVPRTEIDVAAGHDTLIHWIGNDQLPGVLSISKGDAVKIARDNEVIGRGMKKKDREKEFLDSLDRDGALKVSISKRLELVKAPKLVEAK